MKRVSIFITMAVAWLSVLSATEYTYYQKLKDVPPSDIIFCWDIHNTLVKAKTWERTKMKFEVTRLFFWGNSWLPDRTPYKMYQKATQKTGDASAEYLASIYAQKAKEYRARAQISHSQRHHYLKEAERYERLAKLFSSFELQYTDMEGIVPLLNDLKRNGYTHNYVASNIGSGMYQKMKALFPEIFNENMVQDGLVANTWEHPIIKKPNPAFFKRLQEKLNPSGTKTMILIDDEMKNIKSARDVGYIAIQFKSPEKLAEDLRSIGITI